MAKNGPPPTAPGTNSSAGGSKKKLIILSGVVLLLLIAVAVLAFLLLSKPAMHDEEDYEEHKKTPEVEITENSKPMFIPLETFTVNLQGGEQYLQLGINLKFYRPELDERIKSTMPEIRSKILLLLSSKHPEELMTSEGKNKLAMDILAEIAPVIGVRLPENLENQATSAPANSKKLPLEVLFTSFIIQ